MLTMRRMLLSSLAMALGVATVAGTGWALQARRGAAVDPPILVPWHAIGGLTLGESRQAVERKYGGLGHGFHVDSRSGDYVQGHYRLHQSNVDLAYSNGRLTELGFETAYYRTRNGFGVGSRIPLGPCHHTATAACEHRWHGFVWDAWTRDKPCNCWVKVGLGAMSLPATGANFLKPWFFIDIRR